HFATVYAKPKGRPLVDTFITEVSQDTWFFFPWDTALSFQPPIRDGAAWFFTSPRNNGEREKKMTLQNRVLASGEIIARPARGTFTGNRGIIHDPATRTLLRKRWSTVA